MDKPFVLEYIEYDKDGYVALLVRYNYSATIGAVLVYSRHLEDFIPVDLDKFQVTFSLKYNELQNRINEALDSGYLGTY